MFNIPVLKLCICLYWQYDASIDAFVNDNADVSGSGHVEFDVDLGVHVNFDVGLDLICCKCKICFGSYALGT